MKTHLPFDVSFDFLNLILIAAGARMNVKMIPPITHHRTAKDRE